jgi:cyclophilin family peptidyl-prolyl cis-trans isomerase
MPRRISWIAAALALALAAGCGQQEQAAPAAPAEVPEPPLATLPTAVIRVRDLGEIRIALRPDVAPKTVENFTKLATSNFFDGITFHRVIPGFMVQTGDPLSRDRDPRNDGKGGPGYRIDDEPSGIRHVRGVVSMANAGPNTGGSQFFILVGDAVHLDGRHTAFGRVVGGMDVVDRIAAVERDQYGRWGPEDRPMQDVVIESTAVEPGNGAATAAQP